MADVEGKVVIVTGGAQGMGKSHCQVLASRGAQVMIGDIVEDKGKALAREIGSNARFMHLEVTSAKSWAEAVATTEATFGPVTALVNNAGIGYTVPLDDLTEAEYRKFVDINQVGVFLGIKAVLSSMRRRTKGGASIINISSTAGLRGSPHALAYIASKFAVTGMSKAAAIDLGPEGIRVNSVHPGTIGGTGMVQANLQYVQPILDRTPLRRLADLKEVSSLIEYLVSDDSGYCTGGEFVVDGGVTCTH